LADFAGATLNVGTELATLNVGTELAGFFCAALKVGPGDSVAPVAGDGVAWPVLCWTAVKIELKGGRGPASMD